MMDLSIFCKKKNQKKSSKHDFCDACGDEKQVFFLKWPKLVHDEVGCGFELRLIL